MFFLEFQGFEVGAGVLPGIALGELLFAMGSTSNNNNAGGS